MIDIVSHEPEYQIDVIEAFNRMKALARARQMEATIISYYLDRYKSAIDQVAEAAKLTNLQQVIDSVKNHTSTLSQKARELCTTLKPRELIKLIHARIQQKTAKKNYIKNSYKSNKRKRK